jgi:ubiquinone/menaquinone biosynthesis C-methylase UbiE
MAEWKKKRDIMRRYDATAHMYDLRYEQEQTSKYVTALESLQKQELGIVLDVGCGTGLLFPHINRASKRIVGVDISRKTLLKARERARNLSNVEIVCADADFIPLQEGTCDHVFAITLVQNSPRPVRTLEEVKRASKGEAVIVVTGLKRIFSREDFTDLLRKARLHVAAFEDEEDLKCYVAICTKMHH